jgi:hypothetical protein
VKMKDNQQLLIAAILFFVFAVVFSLVLWDDVSLAAKIGMFALGFGSGVTTGGWLALRRSSK